VFLHRFGFAKTGQRFGPTGLMQSVGEYCAGGHWPKVRARAISKLHGPLAIVHGGAKFSKGHLEFAQIAGTDGCLFPRFQANVPAQDSPHRLKRFADAIHRPKNAMATSLSNQVCVGSESSAIGCSQGFEKACQRPIQSQRPQVASHSARRSEDAAG
jgi:hypothetical protein